MDEIDFPLSLYNTNIIDEEFIKQLLFKIEIAKEKRNNIELHKLQEKLTTDLNSVKSPLTNIFKDHFATSKNISELFKIKLEKFKKDYKTNDSEINKLIAYHQLKNNFDFNAITELIKNKVTDFNEKNLQKKLKLKKKNFLR